MWEIFLKLIEQLNSSVFVLLLILIAAGYLIYNMGVWTQKFKNSDEKIAKIESMNEVVIGLKMKVDLICQSVNPNSPTRSASPISITRIGKEIALNIGAEVILKKYEKRLIAEIDKANPKNAYDIQKIAFEVAKTFMVNILNEEELGLLKREAYERGLLLEDIMSIFGVLLRNSVLEVKNLPIADVDKHDPEH